MRKLFAFKLLCADAHGNDICILGNRLFDIGAFTHERIFYLFIRGFVAELYFIQLNTLKLAVGGQSACILIKGIDIKPFAQSADAYELYIEHCTLSPTLTASILSIGAT